MHWLPPPKCEGLEVEQRFEFASPTGEFLYQGYKDFTLRDSKWMPGLPGGAPLVGDHKTTSSLRWMKTKEDLATDVQAIVYAKESLDRWKTDVIHLAWVYYQTKGARKSDRVFLPMLRSQVEPVFAEIDLVAKALVDTFQRAPKAESLPPTPSACKKYGGCPYQYICNLSPNQNLEATMTEMNNPILAMLKSKATNGAPPATEGTYNPRPAWLDAKVDPGPAINPPESTLAPVETRDTEPAPPPTPQVEKPKRHRATKAEMAARAVPAEPVLHAIAEPRTLQEDIAQRTASFQAAKEAPLRVINNAPVQIGVIERNHDGIPETICMAFHVDRVEVVCEDCQIRRDVENEAEAQA